MKQVASQMKEMESKSEKYDELKSSIDDVMHKINDKFGEIQELLSEITPMISMRKVKGKYVNKTYGKTYSKKLIGYIQKAYKYLIDSGELITLPDLMKKLDIDVRGATEHLIRLGLRKLDGIKVVTDSNDARRKLLMYEKGKPKLDLGKIQMILSEKIEDKKLGKLEDAEVSDELKASMPKKFDYMK